ncbi:MAG: hypothetical protein ACXWLH_04400 [Candidatus Saccharimonadales bacterium]
MTITFDDVNFAVGLFSIFLAIFAIVIAIWFFIEAKKSEQQTSLALKGIDDTTKTLDRLSLKLINRLTTAVTSPRATDEKFSDLLKAITPVANLENTDEVSGKFTKAQIEQFRVDNLIAAYYYCSLANISWQVLLPANISDTETDPTIANIVDGSKQDFGILEQWINGTDNAQEKINASPVANLYSQAAGWGKDVRSVREYYAANEVASD